MLVGRLLGEGGGVVLRGQKVDRRNIFGGYLGGYMQYLHLSY